jgi:hypothetical protein
VLLVVGPVSWPLLFIKLFDWKWLTGRLQLPYPTAWDYFFKRRQECFVLVRLKSGKVLGGYWGATSYATSFPNDGEIYLQAVYQLAPDGRITKPIPGTMGALIRKDQYELMEFLAVPQQQSAVYDGG